MAVNAETLPLELEEDAPRGNAPIFTQEELESLELDRRVTLLSFSHQIGELLGTRLLGYFEADKRRIGLSEDDLKRIQEESIEAGLYIGSDDPRYVDREEQPEEEYGAESGLVTIRSPQGVLRAQELNLKLPDAFKHGAQPGVVFPPNEYPKVARSPKDLAKAAMVAQRAKLWEENAALLPEEQMSRSEINEKVKAKARAVLRGFIDSGVKLELEYDDDHEVLLRLRRQTRGLGEGETRTPQNHYKARNLARDLRTADEMFRETLEVAAIYNNWGEKQVQGAHKALTKILYRGISPAANGLAWRGMTELQGGYINARRFKLIQARVRYEQEIARHPKKKDEHSE